MNPFFELFFILVDLYIMVVLLRFFMQYFRVSYYNPVSKFVVTITDPLVKPLRRLIPGIGGIDWSSLLLAFLLGLLRFVLFNSLQNKLGFYTPFAFVFQPLLDLTLNAINLFTYLILIRVILSWVDPFGSNPVGLLFSQLTEPLMRPFRRWLPATGGLDLTPLFAGLALFFVGRLLSYYIQPLIA